MKTLVYCTWEYSSGETVKDHKIINIILLYDSLALYLAIDPKILEVELKRISVCLHSQKPCS